MDLGLAGKSVIVTGGGSNIGRGISLAFAKEGVNLAIADLDETQAQKTAEEAKKKNLNIVSGLCWRYYPPTQEIMKRVLDGAIGDIVAIQETYNTGSISKQFDRKP